MWGYYKGYKRHDLKKSLGSKWAHNKLLPNISGGHQKGISWGGLNIQPYRRTSQSFQWHLHFSHFKGRKSELFFPPPLQCYLQDNHQSYSHSPQSNHVVDHLMDTRRLRQRKTNSRWNHSVPLNHPYPQKWKEARCVNKTWHVKIFW